ncbi:MAG TPA: hypothetical protein VFG69_01295 [Nannocystaceae bacterium]|nr:hypothetical protein [Nannocystaceae bacterium]
MRARRAAQLVALFALAVAAGCIRTGTFACASQDDCVDAGVAGRCEPSGFCSFPDDGCPSHQRYGDHAGDGLGGSCVPEDGTTGGEDTSAASSGPHDATTAASLDTTPLSDGSSESGGASSISGVGTSTTSDDTTGGSTDPTSGSSSGDVVPECPSFVDDFEDAVLDPSWGVMDEAFITEVDGELVLELTPEVDQIYPGVLRMDQDLASGYVRIQVGDAPAVDGERLYLAVAIDSSYADVVYIMIEGALVRMQREQKGALWTTYADIEFDPDVHAWLQIRGENGTVFFETSSDGVTFTPQASADDVFELVATTIVVASTNYLVLEQTGFVSVRELEICNGE